MYEVTPMQKNNTIPSHMKTGFLLYVALTISQVHHFLVGCHGQRPVYMGQILLQSQESVQASSCIGHKLPAGLPRDECKCMLESGAFKMKQVNVKTMTRNPFMNSYTGLLCYSLQGFLT